MHLHWTIPNSATIRCTQWRRLISFNLETLQTREYGGSENLYVIGHNDLGNPSMTSGEEVVIAYNEGAPEAAQTYEELAPSFGDYLFYMLAREHK